MFELICLWFIVLNFKIISDIHQKCNMITKFRQNSWSLRIHYKLDYYLGVKGLKGRFKKVFFLSNIWYMISQSQTFLSEENW